MKLQWSRALCPNVTAMFSERIAKAIRYAFMLAGAAVLGLLTPWLKSHGTTIYVGGALVYLLALAVIAHQLYNRVKPRSDQESA